MKATRAWQRRIKDILLMSGSRQRSRLKRPVWIIVLVTFVIIFLITAFLYPPTTSAACYIFSSRDCTLFNEPSIFTARELSDEETRSHVVFREILNTPPIQSKNPKIAFLFLTPGTLHFEPLWDKFFRVVWGKFSMVDIERRLLARSLLDPDNQQFLLLSDSCVPLHNFDYVYNYLMLTNVSFIDCFVDLGPHGTGRYSERMMPEVEKNAFRKGSQWFSMKRQHAIIVMADNLYYRKFKNYCKPHMDGRNCYSDEHYLPTFFNMIDPSGVANRSVTYVDWSEGKWHPRAFRAQDITFEFLKNLTFIEESIHFTSGPKRRGISRPCLWNSMKRPCYLFARKFYPETLHRLIIHFSNYTTI
ncbi:Polycomb group RING finger 6 [Gossypium arboreum]|uniref:Polycomb group RING finger 6 n=1 Tax=Gossypium arboreum TaxID=29729 RepID=A0A0B0Q083_GOSAR|nr:Polycomb group RING finger 6 [Gossypium arboreum]